MISAKPKYGQTAAGTKTKRRQLLRKILPTYSIQFYLKINKHINTQTQRLGTCFITSHQF